MEVARRLEHWYPDDPCKEPLKNALKNPETLNLTLSTV